MIEKHKDGERGLRFAAPALYKRMVEVFSEYHIHPYDVQGTLMKTENGYVVTVRFSAHFSESLTKQITAEQAGNPDEEMTCFFREAAEACKSMLIADYYKMIKL